MGFIAAMLAVFMALVVGVVVDLIFAVPLMYAWDGVMPHVFHLPTISFWQAFAMLIVATLLFRAGSAASSSSSCKSS